MQAGRSQSFWNSERSLCDVGVGIPELGAVVPPAGKAHGSCFDAARYSHKYTFSSLTDYDFKALACWHPQPLCQSYSSEEQETIAIYIPCQELHTKQTSALGLHYLFGPVPIKFERVLNQVEKKCFVKLQPSQLTALQSAMQNKASIKGFQLHAGAKQAAFNHSGCGLLEGSVLRIRWYISACK